MVHDLDELHQVHEVEEVHADNRLGSGRFFAISLTGNEDVLVATSA